MNDKPKKLGRPFGKRYADGLPPIRVETDMARAMRRIAEEHFNGNLSEARRDAYKFYVMWSALGEDKQKQIVDILFFE